MFGDNVVVSSSRFEKVHNDSDIHGNFNPLRFDHQILLKYLVPITQWHGSTSQKNCNPI
jgi:hypothetical protein